MVTSGPPTCAIFLVSTISLKPSRLFQRSGGVGLLPLRAPEAHSVHGVFDALPGILRVRKFLVRLLLSDSRVSLVHVVHRRWTVCHSFTRLFSLLAICIEGYSLRRFSSTSGGNCSLTGTFLPFRVRGARLRINSPSLKKMNLAL